MAKTDVVLNLDATLVARAKALSSDLSATVEVALRRYLDRGAEDTAADRRWAEDNALAVEALAGGVEETAER